MESEENGTVLIPLTLIPSSLTQLMTAMFDFHKVGSALKSPTPSPVKTSLIDSLVPIYKLTPE